MPKIVVADHTFDPLDIEERILAKVDGTLAAYQCKKAAELAALVADADVVITQFSPVTAEVVAAMKKVRVIVRYGTGVDNVDLDAARQRRIPVCNVAAFCIPEANFAAAPLPLSRWVGLGSTRSLRSSIIPSAPSWELAAFDGAPSSSATRSSFAIR